MRTLQNFIDGSFRPAAGGATEPVLQSRHRRGDRARAAV